MDLLTVKQNGEHTGSIGLSGQNTTEIQRFLAADTLLTVNAHNNNINAKRNVPFLLRNLRRRLPSNGTIPRYLKVYNANVKGYDRGIQEHIYKRRKDIRCKLCLTEPHMTDREALWLHCRRRHADYHPELIRSTDGVVHLLLNKGNGNENNSLERISRTGESQFLYCHRIPFFPNSEVLPPNDVCLPRRTYYNSVFKKPKPEAAWLLDIDSDDEVKSHFRSIPDKEVEIDDYVDVSTSQKRFMKSWNSFLAHETDGIIVSPRSLPRICLDFTSYYARHHSFCDEGEEPLVLFLLNLVDESHLTVLEMEQIIIEYRFGIKRRSK